MNPSSYPLLEAYIKDLLLTLGQDKRVFVWDLYNEPGNGTIFGGEAAPDASRELTGLAPCSHQLMLKTFRWARDCRPSQPLTIGAWQLSPPPGNPWVRSPVDTAALGLSDLITFHFYGTARDLPGVLEELSVYQRPLICTEWMARHRGSTIKELLPLFAEKKTGCCQWGLVRGKTQTHFPWNPIKKQCPGWRDLWFHDLLYEDGRPYDAGEVELYRRFTGKDLPG